MAPAEYAGQLSEGYQVQHRRLSQKRQSQRASRFSLREAAFTVALMAMVSGLSGMAVYRVTSSRIRAKRRKQCSASARATACSTRAIVLAARASYARALALGEASAALRLGKTYDPASSPISRSRGCNRQEHGAALYQQAADAGISDAKALLTTLQLAEE